MTATDHYKVLGIARNASEDEIKKAYRQLAKQWHPDKNKDPGAEDKFKEIGAAYETLKDGEKRRVYNMQKDGDAEREKMRRENASRTFGTGNNTTNTGSGFSSRFGPGSSFSFNNGGANFTFRSTFSTFGDTDKNKKSRKEQNKENNASSGTNAGKDKNSRKKAGGKTYDSNSSFKQRRTFDFGRPEWSHDFHDPEDDSTFSFKFFDSTNPFKDDPFEDFDKMFDDFFQDPFFSRSTMPKPMFEDIFDFNNMSGTSARARPEFNVFGYTQGHGGTEGSSPRRHRARRKSAEEDMWDWSNPIFGDKRKQDEDLYEDTTAEGWYGVHMCTHTCTLCTHL